MRKAAREYARAMRHLYSYDVRRNPWTWFGLIWGLPIPICSIALDLLFGTGGRGPWDAVREHPLHLFFLAHPFLFAIAFGPFGTLARARNRRMAGLQAQAITDPLTGVYNRRFVMEELSRLISRSERSGHPFILMTLDLDFFKAVNEAHGHLVGDQILRNAAQSLRGVTRQGDVVGRYGGDEFLLLLHNELTDLAEFMRRAAEAVFERTGVSVSAGVAHWPVDGTTPEDLIRAADVALSIAKRRHHENQPAGHP